MWWMIIGIGLLFWLSTYKMMLPKETVGRPNSQDKAIAFQFSGGMALALVVAALVCSILLDNVVRTSNAVWQPVAQVRILECIAVSGGTRYQSWTSYSIRYKTQSGAVDVVRVDYDSYRHCEVGAQATLYQLQDKNGKPLGRYTIGN